MVGRVTSVKSAKTATVIVERKATHPLYKKTYTQSKKYLVDDQIGVKLGDIVEFISCKPVSKNKHWKITKVLGKNFAEIAKGELKKEAEAIIAEVMPEEKKGEGESGKGEEEKPEKPKISEVIKKVESGKRKSRKEDN